MEVGDMLPDFEVVMNDGSVVTDEILKENNLTVGVDVGLIAYNDVPLNSVVLGGLTTISTDFVKMGKLAAEMILSRKMTKIHNGFRMIRRNTF